MDSYQQKDLTIKRCDLCLKALTLGLAVLLGVLAYKDFTNKTEQYRAKQEDDRIKDRELKEKDFKIRFYEKQADVYFELCDVASRIASARRTSAVLKELSRFNELVIGKLAVVGDPKVFEAVWDFNDELKKLRSDAGIPKSVAAAAWRISEACRASLREAFPSIGHLVGHRDVGELIVPFEK